MRTILGDTEISFSECFEITVCVYTMKVGLQQL